MCGDGEHYWKTWSNSLVLSFRISGSGVLAGDKDFTFHLSVQGHSPDVLAGFNTLDANLAMACRTGLSYPCDTKASAAMATFKTNNCAPLEPTGDAFNPRPARSDVHGAGVDVEQLSSRVHAPNAHRNFQRRPLLTRFFHADIRQSSST